MNNTIKVLLIAQARIKRDGLRGTTPDMLRSARAELRKAGYKPARTIKP